MLSSISRVSNSYGQQSSPPPRLFAASKSSQSLFASTPQQNRWEVALTHHWLNIGLAIVGASALWFGGSKALSSDAPVLNVVTGKPLFSEQYSPKQLKQAPGKTVDTAGSLFGLGLLGSAGLASRRSGEELKDAARFWWP